MILQLSVNVGFVLQDIAEEMTTNIMRAFKERINSRDWLDEPTKERARRKVGALT